MLFEFWVQMTVTIICSVLASSGIWALVLKRIERKDAKTELLIGMAHDRIMFLGTSYLNRGYITRDEYENLHEYLYAPYKKAGGNGSAEHMIQQVDKLPFGKDENAILADLS